MMLFQAGGAGGLGFITGYAVKKIFEAIMIIVGVFVMGLFALASTGSVTLHWDKVFAFANVGSAQVADFTASISSIMLQHFQVGGGFLLGFVAALRK